MVNSNKITRKIYQERANILVDVSIFEVTPYWTNAFKYDLKRRASSGTLIPSLIISKNCYHCKHESLWKIPVININVNIILQNGLFELQNAILDTNFDENSTCKKCQESASEKYNFQSHLLIDCSVFTDERYAASIGIKKKSATLGFILKILKIKEQNNAIVDAVSYHQYASDKNNGHYTA